MNKLARPFVIMVEKLFPESFVFAIGLSIVVFLACWGLTDSGPMQIIDAWGTGLADLLSFMAQDFIDSSVRARSGPHASGAQVPLRIGPSATKGLASVQPGGADRGYRFAFRMGIWASCRSPCGPPSGH